MCRSNININDVLGDYSLGLLESLGTLAVSNYCAVILNCFMLPHPPHARSLNILRWDGVSELKYLKASMVLNWGGWVSSRGGGELVWIFLEQYTPPLDKLDSQMGQTFAYNIAKIISK